MTWMHSPLLTLCLWPEWYAPPQRDWPPNVRFSNFPLYEGAGIDQWPDSLDAFLNDGPPPVAFTLGATMPQGKAFFQESVVACRYTGNRGILLTSNSEEVPDNLPLNVRAFGSVPFRRLLPRVDALVHSGGIAYTGQALAAGIPQIVIPTAFDQPDNAARLRRLGLSLTLPPKSYWAKNVAGLLTRLKSDPSYRLRAEEIRQHSPSKDGITLSCDIIEAASKNRWGID